MQEQSRIANLLCCLKKYESVKTEKKDIMLEKRLKIDVDVLISYPWTSCPAYFGKPSDICVPDEVISMFNSRESYKTFLKKEAEARISLSPKLVIDLEE